MNTKTKKKIILTALRVYRDELNEKIDRYTDDDFPYWEINHIEEIVYNHGYAWHMEKPLGDLIHKIKHQRETLRVKEKVFDEINETQINELFWNELDTEELTKHVSMVLDRYKDEDCLEHKILSVAIKRIDKAVKKLNALNESTTLFDVSIEILRLKEPTID